MEKSKLLFPVDVNPSALTWLSVPLGRAEEKVLVLRNKTTDDAELTLAVKESEDFKLGFSDTKKLIVPARSTSTVAVTFAPSRAGFIPGKLVLRWKMRQGATATSARALKASIPLQGHGVTVMSIGFMVAEEDAIVWRGPMLMGALQQFLGQVDWGDLDVLIVDLPPGPGDVQISLAQKAEVTGAVIVSTPQDVALLDAKKAISMFEKLNVPLLGMVENMGSYICPDCGHEAHIFGNGGAEAEAARRGIPFLGRIPLDLDIRLASDNGEPIVAGQPQSPQAAAFTQIAERIMEEARG